MARVLITGLSGTGKSSLVEALVARGLRGVDLDSAEWSEWVPCEGDPTGAKPSHDWCWREDKLSQLLEVSDAKPLYVSGCAPNMGRFLDRFNHVVLLSAPLDVLLDRVRSRTNNPYGQRESEAAQIAANLREIEPPLRKIATDVVDATRPLEDIVQHVLSL